MARIINLLFDGLLVKDKIVCNRDFSAVHIWMDEHYPFYHWQNTNSSIEEIKELILAETSETDLAVLSDYLRVALGHILLESLSYDFAFDSENALIRTAFQLYLDRGFRNCRINDAIVC